MDSMWDLGALPRVRDQISRVLSRKQPDGSRNGAINDIPGDSFYSLSATPFALSYLIACTASPIAVFLPLGRK